MAQSRKTYWQQVAESIYSQWNEFEAERRKLDPYLRPPIGSAVIPPSAEEIKKELSAGLDYFVEMNRWAKDALRKIEGVINTQASISRDDEESYEISRRRCVGMINFLHHLRPKLEEYGISIPAEANEEDEPDDSPSTVLISMDDEEAETESASDQKSEEGQEGDLHAEVEGDAAAEERAELESKQSERAEAESLAAREEEEKAAASIATKKRIKDFIASQLNLMELPLDEKAKFKEKWLAMFDALFAAGWMDRDSEALLDVASYEAGTISNVYRLKEEDHRIPFLNSISDIVASYTGADEKDRVIDELFKFRISLMGEAWRKTIDYISALSPEKKIEEKIERKNIAEELNKIEALNALSSEEKAAFIRKWLEKFDALFPIKAWNREESSALISTAFHEAQERMIIDMPPMLASSEKQAFITEISALTATYTGSESLYPIINNLEIIHRKLMALRARMSPNNKEEKKPERLSVDEIRQIDELGRAALQAIDDLNELITREPANQALYHSQQEQLNLSRVQMGGVSDKKGFRQFQTEIRPAVETIINSIIEKWRELLTQKIELARLLLEDSPLEGDHQEESILELARVENAIKVIAQN